MVVEIPLFAGFYAFQVVQDFFHQQYSLARWWFHVFFNHPYLGKWSNFDLRIFFRWVESTNQLTQLVIYSLRFPVMADHEHNLHLNCANEIFLTSHAMNDQMKGANERSSRKLTWNMKIIPLKRKLIFQTSIFRFHVSFRESNCQVEIFKSQKNILSPVPSSFQRRWLF